MSKFTHSYRKTLLVIPNHLHQSIKEIAHIFKILKFPNFVLYTQKVSFNTGFTELEKLMLSKKCDSFISFNQKKDKEAFTITMGRMFNNFLLHSIKLNVPLRTAKVTNKKAEFLDSSVPVFSFIIENNESLKSIVTDVFRNSFEFNEVNLFQKLVMVRQIDENFKLIVARINTQTKNLQEEYLQLEFTIVEENNFETEDILNKAYPKPQQITKKKTKLESDDIHGKVGRIYTTKQNLHEVKRQKRVHK